MSKSSIEWTDETWNPITGCTRVSAGCDNCYAVKMTKRLEAMGQEKYSDLVNLGKGHFNGVVKCHEESLLIPLKARKGRRWFVNSMSDLFHKDVPFEFIDKVFAIMAMCPQHTFQILTKRPERAAEYFRDVSVKVGFPGSSDWDEKAMTRGEYVGMRMRGTACDFAWNTKEELRELADKGADLQFHGSPKNWPLPNVWIGTSIEDQATADERIPHLLKVPAAVRFLSCEPLLGSVDLTPWMPAGFCKWQCGACGKFSDVEVDRFDHLTCPHCSKVDYLCGSHVGNSKPNGQSISWVIAGGESGPEARPMHPEWVRSLRDQCDASGVPFFFKQWGEWHPANSNELRKGLVADGWVKPNGNAKYQYHSGFNKSPKTLEAEGFAFLAKVGKHKAGRLLDGKEHNAFPEVA